MSTSAGAIVRTMRTLVDSSVADVLFPSPVFENSMP